MVDGWLHRIQAIVLPPSCILCGDRGQQPLLDLCFGCAADLPANAGACARCAAPLPIEPAGCLECGRCMTRPPAFDRAVVPHLYGYPLDRIIQMFKYHGALAFGRVLGTLLARHLQAGANARRAPQALIPVPLHPARHRERGFNQALELARPVSEMLDIRIDDGLCRRVRDTRDQTELDARERRKNIRRAFALTRDPVVEHVALIDDVLTTGSTTAELARTLKRAGVKTVEVWAVARAVDGTGCPIQRQAN